MLFICGAVVSEGLQICFKRISFFQLRVRPTAMSSGGGEGMGKESMTKEYCRGRFRGLEGKRKQDQDWRYSSCFLTFCLN